MASPCVRVTVHLCQQPAEILSVPPYPTRQEDARRRRGGCGGLAPHRLGQRQGTCASSAGPLHRVGVSHDLRQRETSVGGVAWSAEGLPWCISKLRGATPAIASCMALSGTDGHHRPLLLRYEGNTHIHKLA